MPEKIPLVIVPETAYVKSDVSDIASLIALAQATGGPEAAQNLIDMFSHRQFFKVFELETMLNTILTYRQTTGNKTEFNPLLSLQPFHGSAFFLTWNQKPDTAKSDHFLLNPSSYIGFLLSYLPGDHQRKYDPGQEWLQSTPFVFLHENLREEVLRGIQREFDEWRFVPPGTLRKVGYG